MCMQSSSGQNCQGGICENPYEKGCLVTVAAERGETIPSAILAEGKDKIKMFQERFGDLQFGDEKGPGLGRGRGLGLGRVCNSNDLGIDGYDKCVKEAEHQYDEVRIAPGNWDSSFYLTWVLQILLSELLRVPTTVEFGFNNKKHTSSMGSFYDEKSRYTFGESAYCWDCLKEAHDMGGMCADTDKPCAHIVPEIWSGREFIAEEYILLPNGNGLTGQLGYYIPRFTAENYPELISHFGLRNNPQKLAEIFKTPITWGEYCDTFTSNCSNKDDNEIATRLPSSDRERKKYFLEGSYTGFFKENGCNDSFTNCTGHFVDTYCGWTTYAESQFHWQNIALASAGPNEPNNGYSNEQLVEIVFAANATKSDLLFWWYEPELLTSSFQDTDMEFQRIKLAAATPECIKNREENKVERCKANLEERQGAALGSCDYPLDELKMAISKGLDDMTNQATESSNSKLLQSAELMRNPSLDFLNSFQLSALSMNNLMKKIFNNPGEEFKYRVSGVQEEMGSVYRRAVCEWVYDNIVDLVDKVPNQFPRSFKKREPNKSMKRAALTLGIFTIVLVAAIAVLTLKWKIKETIKVLAVDCWIWILIGFALIGASAISNVYESACGWTYWLLVLGHVLELTPILIKVWTINKMVRYARIQQRADVKSRHLNAILLASVLTAVLFLIVWRAVDPQTLENISTMDPKDQYSVAISEVCTSNSNFWRLCIFGLLGLLLFLATVLTFQSRHVFEEFNESQGLAFLIYSHFIFIVLQIVFYQIERSEVFPRDVSTSAMSVLWSLDAIFAMLFYFGQKFLSIMNKSKKPMRVLSASQIISNKKDNADGPDEADEEKDAYDDRKTLEPDKQFSLELKEMMPVSALSEWGPH
jgi:hypothetical protein